jgi:predicted nuclease with TOPRIM domain
MSTEKQIRTIIKVELEKKLAEFEKQLQENFGKELGEAKGDIEEIGVQLEELSARLGKLEEDLSKRLGILVKLRKYTLDQLMSEYKRLKGSMRPEQEELGENADI